MNNMKLDDVLMFLEGQKGKMEVRDFSMFSDVPRVLVDSGFGHQRMVKMGPVVSEIKLTLVELPQKSKFKRRERRRLGVLRKKRVVETKVDEFEYDGPYDYYVEEDE